VDLYLGRARGSLALQLYEEAAEDARNAATREPTKAAAWAVLGQALYYLGNDEEAIRALDRSLDLDERQADALRLRGDAHWARRSFPLAAQDYAAAAALAPEDAELGLCLAEARFELGDTAAALAQAEAAVAAQPDLSDAYVLLARAHAASGDLASALGAVERGIEATADEPELYVERARLYREQAKSYLAWRDLRWAIDLDPGNAEAYVLRAQLALELEGTDEALADLDAALEIDPHDGLAYAWRGYAQKLAGHAHEAAEDWSAAEDLLDPNDPLRDQILAWRRGDG
jgi:tetratricopeptide (TPR) repeat protein